MINTVKLQGDSYLVNGNMSVPKVNGNMDYEAVKEWLLTNTPEPEFTEAELAKQAQEKVNADALAFLASTDWYIIRLQESGIAVPQTVLDARATARLQVVVV